MGKLSIFFLLIGASAVLLTGNCRVAAKPFLLSPNFFVLTTRAPANGEHRSSQVATTYQLPDFITPKLRFLAGLLQGSSGGGGSGGFSFGVNKFAGFGTAATTTEKTTTYKPFSTTRVVTEYVPESTESSFASSTARTTTATSSTTKGGDSEYSKPTVRPATPATTTERSPGYEYSTTTGRGGYEYSTTTGRSGYEYTTKSGDKTPGYEYTTDKTSGYGFQVPDSENEVLSVAVNSLYLPPS